MLVGKNVLIWNLRGAESAAELLDSNPGFQVSAVTYMQLAQGVRDKAEFRALHRALSFWNAKIIHISEAISARASFLVEQHALSDPLQLADALIAATVLEHGLVLLTGNDKHYQIVEGLEIRVFRP